MKWHDGSDFTADDVVFSADRVRSEESLLRSMLATVKHTRKVDPFTVDFETERPDRFSRRKSRLGSS